MDTAQCLVSTRSVHRQIDSVRMHRVEFDARSVPSLSASGTRIEVWFGSQVGHGFFSPGLPRHIGQIVLEHIKSPTPGT